MNTSGHFEFTEYSSHNYCYLDNRTPIKTSGYQEIFTTLELTWTQGKAGKFLEQKF